MILKPILLGFFAMLALLGLYFLVLGLISGTSFALAQFRTFWYFIIILSGGFGLQIGLYIYLRKAIRQASDGSGKVVAVSGTTSAIAMISCCSHYLVNILPIIGITVLVTFISQYQIQFFWLGLTANLAGISYLLRKIIKVRDGRL